MQHLNMREEGRRTGALSLVSRESAAPLTSQGALIRKTTSQSNEQPKGQAEEQTNERQMLFILSIIHICTWAAQLITFKWKSGFILISRCKKKKEKSFPFN